MKFIRFSIVAVQCLRQYFSELPAETMALRQPAASSTAPTPGREGGGSNSSGEMVVYVALPLIIAVFLAIIALLLLLVYLAMRAKGKQHRYTRIAKEESRLTNLSSLPFPSLKPPAIKMGDPPSPEMTSAIAPQLPSSPTSQRYPFIKHKRQENKSIYSQERRPPRLRTKRAGNHKHAKGFRAIFKEGDSPDSQSPERSPSQERAEEGKGGGRKLSVISLGQFSDISPQTFTVSAAKKQVQRSPSTAGRPPEIFLSLSYLKEKTTLVVTVQRVVGLPPRDDGTAVDAYVRIYFIPRLPEMSQRKTSKTRTAKSESDPVFQETIFYEAMSEEELINSTLHVQVLDYRTYGRHQIIGQSEVALMEIPLKEEEESVVLQLTPPRTSVSLGTVLLSMCYSTESKKLSVILLRAKDLNRGNTKETDAQAKLQVSVGDKVVGRLRTKRKPESCSPIFNEALTCTMDPEQVQRSVIQVCIFNEHKSATRRELGNVMLSSKCIGEEFRHWNDVLAQPGKHIAEWHELRQR